MDVDLYPQIAENVTKTYFFGEDKQAPPGSFNAKSFLDHVELHRRRYAWTDAQTVNYAVTSMRGSAYDWFQMLQQILSDEMRTQLLATWSVFKEAVMAHYNIGGMAKRPQVKAALDLARSLPLRDFFTRAMTEYIASAKLDLDRWFNSMTPANTWGTILERQLPNTAAGDAGGAAYRAAALTHLTTYLETLETTQNASRKSKLWDIMVQQFIRNILVDHIPFSRTREKAYEFIADKPDMDNFEFFEKLALFDERNNPNARKNGASVHEVQVDDDPAQVEAIKKGDAKKKEKEACKYCGIVGHKIKRCFKKKRDDKKKEDAAKKVNEVAASSNDSPSLALPTPAASATAVAMLDALSGNEYRW